NMTTETANVVAIILGILGLIWAVFALVVQSYISKRTDRLIEKEDERAKRMIEATERMIEEGNKRHEELMRETQRIIEEGNKRLEKILLKIDESTKEVLGEIIKKGG
ncbi:hypothetical protein, partial [Escherichia coli]|uniref:hypothetical protein n=1 Tax=Escherichia coli TaxID=562 RepID=UPI00128F834D